VFWILLPSLTLEHLNLLQFSQKNHQRVMITSRDSKVRILEGVELVQTYKGMNLVFDASVRGIEI
jgi:hypothetical protein